MYDIAEFRGFTHIVTKNGNRIGKAQFLVGGLNFDRPIICTVFDKDNNFRKFESLKKGQEVILEYNQKLKNQYLEIYFNSLITDKKKIEMFKSSVVDDEKIPYVIGE